MALAYLEKVEARTDGALGVLDIDTMDDVELGDSLRQCERRHTPLRLSDAPQEDPKSLWLAYPVIIWP